MPNYLWLEVSNVKAEAKKVSVQVKGDKEPAWWVVEDETYKENAKEIFQALDSKKIVLAGIKAAQQPVKPEDDELVVGCIRIQFSDSGSR